MFSQKTASCNQKISIIIFLLRLPHHLLLPGSGWPPFFQCKCRQLLFQVILYIRFRYLGKRTNIYCWTRTYCGKNIRIFYVILI